MSEETKNQSGTRGLQREASSHEKEVRELRQKIISIRQGHLTGGYCDTEALKVEEKKLWKILSEDLSEAKKKFGDSPDPKFKPKEVRAIEVELFGLSYRPVLVEKGVN